MLKRKILTCGYQENNRLLSLSSDGVFRNAADTSKKDGTL